MFRKKNNGSKIPYHKSMSELPRSMSFGCEYDKPLPLNISVSVPSTPRNDSESYCKAISQVNLRVSERRKEEEIRKITAALEESTSDDEYYSAYYDDESTSQDSSELGNLKEQQEAENMTKLLTSSPRNSSFQNLPNKNNNNQDNQLNNQVNRQKDLGYRPKDQNKNETPGVPQLKLPNNRKNNYSTLSQLKTPCSPRLLKSRSQLEEDKKVIELQKMLFELRVTFWKIENSREHAIKKYISLASKAGFIICDNCKRLLRKKRCNYHIKRHSRRHPNKIYYKCTRRSYEQHFIATPAGKFFPLSFEK